MGINIDDIVNEFKCDKKLTNAFNTYDKYINYRFNFVIRACLIQSPDELNHNVDYPVFDPTQQILLACINSNNNENNVAKLREDLKLLTSENHNKRKEVSLMTQQEEGLRKNIQYLEEIISIKENFIQETANFVEIRCNAKDKVQKEYYKVNKKYNKILNQLYKSNKAFKTNSNNGACKQIEYLNEKVLKYETKIKKMEDVIKIAGDSKEKLQQYQSALKTSKDRLKIFNDQLNSQIKNKQDITSLILENEKRIQLLKRNLSNIGVLSSIEKSRVHTSSNFIEDDNLKKEFLELQNMRNEVLGSRPKGMFNPKYQKEKNLTKEEIRRYLENDEAIDSIDYLIELKNTENNSQTNLLKLIQTTSNETNIFLRCLSTLSLEEIKKLLVHYFTKNVDLKESGRENDDLIANLDETIDRQKHTILTLNNNFQEFHLSIEKKFESLKKYYQGKINTLFTHLQEENNAITLFKMRQEIINLKKKIAELEKEKLLSAKSKEVPVMSEPQNKCLDHLEASKSGSETMSSTKVTLHKNKLKIQKNKSKLTS